MLFEPKTDLRRVRLSFVWLNNAVPDLIASFLFALRVFLVSLIFRSICSIGLLTNSFINSSFAANSQSFIISKNFIVLIPPCLSIHFEVVEEKLIQFVLCLF
jgi:hypothetical protein